MRENSLSEIPAFAFESLINVKELDLSDNLISHVDTNAFGGMSSLTSLGLQKNLLNTIPVVLAFHQLQHVNLIDNLFGGEHHGLLTCSSCHQALLSYSAVQPNNPFSKYSSFHFRNDHRFTQFEAVISEQE